eukprot:m.79071 g.79071  ORF g.79071 m.79071 type:complete len:52 (+) comp25176_c0_seq1:1724-1879(+)
MMSHMYAANFDFSERFKKIATLETKFSSFLLISRFSKGQFIFALSISTSLQ